MAIPIFQRTNSRQELIEQGSPTPVDGETENIRTKWSFRLYILFAIINCILGASVIAYGLYVVFTSPNKLREIIGYALIATGILEITKVMFVKFLPNKSGKATSFVVNAKRREVVQVPYRIPFQMSPTSLSPGCLIYPH
nr:hypothetical transcript [Hymenolepis microstoma]